ncbi:hypothetical protein CROQUDRAFT_41766 [Cronartium quercuum f. sp. fusiforme G11]|uniref:Man(5)GlcNAc(2)-PP-dolichol translocation protein RFT1 n=1 Tax=Cronartium quercuum f. sp. fusiforme G11 TaxID=708437 RepID=A0A9P6NPV4_9BASI|nr:hypothetical protein CROQUDRAFT_41766 [Cronartium quercuum f. sp. fusiforme G11]
MSDSHSQPNLLQISLSFILLQLFSKLLTFSLNQTLIRFTSPELLGTTSIQFDVLSNSILFITREHFRAHLSRLQIEFSHQNLTKSRHQQIVNHCYLPIPIGFILSTISFSIYHHLTINNNSSLQHNFKLSLFIYYLSTLFEFISEPAYLYHLITAQTSPRIKVEAIAVFLKSFITLLIIYSGARLAKDWALLAFSFGQLTFASCLLIGLWISKHSIKTDKKFLPKWIIKKSILNSPLAKHDHPLGEHDFNLICALARQSILKQFLSEGDKMIVGRLCPIANQGSYALALNYGSLVARIIFQPIEESARLYFSKTLGPITNNHKPIQIKEDSDKQVESSKENLKEDQPNDHHLIRDEAITTLSALILFQSYLGLILITFVPSYIKPALILILGPNSSYLSGHAIVINILKTYCNLLPLLALNGILEAFVQSVANQKELKQMNSMMILWCITYIGSIYLFKHLNEIGMIYSNCINMMFRILYSYHFIIQFLNHHQHKSSHSLLDIIPNPLMILVFMIFNLVLRYYEKNYFNDFIIRNHDHNKLMIDWNQFCSHLSIGIICFITCLIIG